MFADIAFRRRIPAANNGLFTFSVPQNLTNKITEGCLVEAKLKDECARAVVVRLHEKKPIFQTEEILDVCTPPLLESWQMHLSEKVAQKNWVPLAKVLPLVLPKKIFEGSGNPPTKHIVRLLSPEKDTKKRGKKMEDVLNILKEENEYERMELQKKSGCTKDTIVKLEERGCVEIVSLPQFLETTSFPDFEETLTDEQKEVQEKIFSSSKSLLFAPTGSGKSYLLRSLARKYAQKGESVFFLLPEIALTEEVQQVMHEAFGKDAVVLFHSRLSEGEKAQAFWKVKIGAAKVIVGSRASLFLPFQKLGAVFVEEEHEWTFKSDQSPRYHARDVAEFLAETHHCPLVFSSATPSLETYSRTDISHFSLSERTLLPHVSLIDMSDEKEGKNYTGISRVLQEKIRNTLTKNEQVLLFLNRRGMFRVLLCKGCGEISRCLGCGTALVTHSGKGKNFLLCHSCGKVYNIPSSCRACGSTELESRGSGTANIERLLQNMFPQENVVRIDRDTTSKKYSFEELYSQFSNGQKGILVGTQIVAKGIDFSHVGLVGILDADAGIHIPDFRAAEKSFALLRQVMGRAGRRGQSSTVVLQTHSPHSSIFGFIKNHDTKGFLEQEMDHRKTFFLPPYSRIIKLIFTAPNKDIAFANARKTEKILQNTCTRKFPEEKIHISVAPALTPRKHGKFFVNLLLTAKNPEEVLRSIPLKGCRVDVDPIDVVS